MHSQLLVTLTTLIAATQAVDIRFYTGTNCRGSFVAWSVPVGSCFPQNARSFSWTDVKPEDGDLRITGYTGAAGCDGGQVGFTTVTNKSGGCSTTGSYTGVGVEAA